jgi:hypothetical protein
MKNKTFTFMLSAIIIIAAVAFGAKIIKENTSINKVTINDDYDYISINRILMWVSNNGDGSHDPYTDGNGFYWPDGMNAGKSAIFEDGLIWGGYVQGQIQVNGNTHRQGLQAGKILNDSTADDPSLPKYRVYKIRKDWQNLPPGSEKDEYETDYNEWPVEDGAPWVDTDGDGIFTRGVDQPEFIGDEVLWFVSNDLDASRTTRTFGSQPIGLEVQTTVFGFNKTGDLGDVVFKKYLIINKCLNTIEDMILGYWSDSDVGYAVDDYSGCDIDLNLGYTYNGDNWDEGYYDEAPPAVGYDFLQGPIVEGLPTDSAKFLGRYIHGYKNQSLTAFTMYCSGFTPISDWGIIQGSEEFYNNLKGYFWNGEPFIDPCTGNAVKFCVPGDPVTATGWYEGPGWPGGGPPPSDRRHLMASGPFTMAPGDTQEVVIGIIIAKGNSNLNSVNKLKHKDITAQNAYDFNFQIPDSPPSPKTHASARDRSVFIYWERNAESYEKLTYKFEGYRVWQARDLAGTDAQVVETIDIQNEIKIINDYIDVNDVYVLSPVIISPDEGIKRFVSLETDTFTNSSLLNGSPYYFAVTAYGYSSKRREPAYIESPPEFFELIPSTPKIDVTTIYNNGDKLFANHIEGDADGSMEIKILEPHDLTGHEYCAYIYGTQREDMNLRYSLFDMEEDPPDTIAIDVPLITLDDYNKIHYIGADSVYTNVYDGFIVMIKDLGVDSLDAMPGRQKYGIKSVLEVKGPGGVTLENPVDVLGGKFNSTAKWTLLGKGDETDQRLNLDWKDYVGFDNYEIRFTERGSEFYLTGYKIGFPAHLPLKNDPKSKERVPFEIWNIGRDLDSDTDDYRLAIKVMDLNRSDTSSSIADSVYSQLPDGRWEAVYAYYDSTYKNDVLIDVSEKSEAWQHHIGCMVFQGEMPEQGSVIRITPFRPLVEGNVFSIIPQAPNTADKAAAKNNIDEISVFPNPYFGAYNLERDEYQRFVRFTNLPTEVTVRIFSLAGIFVKKIEKNDQSQWLDWDLRNSHGKTVASGIYIAHLDMPGIGTKILKLAVVQEVKY